MPRGGRREGAGRKKGTKTTYTVELKKKALSTGISPLEYMLRIMRDPKAAQSRRDKMAMGAAKFCHPTLSSVEQHVPPGGVARELKENMTVQEAQDAYTAKLKEAGFGETKH